MWRTVLVSGIMWEPISFCLSPFLYRSRLLSPSVTLISCCTFRLPQHLPAMRISKGEHVHTKCSCFAGRRLAFQSNSIVWRLSSVVVLVLPWRCAYVMIVGSLSISSGARKPLPERNISQLAPNASVPRKCCSEHPDEIIFTLDAKRLRCT